MNQALRAYKARTYTTLTYNKWNFDPRIQAAPEAVEEMNLFTKLGGQDQGQTDLIGISPSETSPADPVSEYRMEWAVHEQLAGFAVIRNFVIDPYNVRPSAGRSFSDTFDRSNRNTIFGSFGRNSEYEDLTRAVRAKIEAVEAEDTFETSNPVLFAEGKEVFNRLRDAALPGLHENATATRTDAGRKILDIVADYIEKYADDTRGIGHERNALYNKLFFDPFEAGINQEDTSVAWARTVMAGGIEYYARTYDGFIIPKLNEIDRQIAALGDLTFFPPPDQNDNQPQLAHEATLQNIRFLRNMLEEARNDLWTQGTSLNAFIVDAIVQLRDQVLSGTRSNSIINLTITEQVENNELEVSIKDINDPSASWSGFTGKIVDIGNGLKGIDVSHLKTSGNYVIQIRPRTIDIGIVSVPLDGVVSTPDLDNDQSQNYFYGWNIEFSQAGDNGLPLGEQRMIVGSTFTVNNSRLFVSPNIKQRGVLQENTEARIWPNTFIPVMIDLELTDHNAETLAYANYAKREFNQRTGVLKLYDFRGKLYKQWTIGERTTEESGYEPIEFRDPIKDE
jgi:hypothetical protein